MATRVVEWKKPYTWGKAIEIDENKVISLRLRDENNLIIYDEWDDEIYVDLQLPDEITPTDAFPVWITTGRVIVDNGWDVQGTIIVAKTTSGDNIKILYADDGKLYMDNGTWSFKQIYFKADVDLIVDSLQAQIDVLSGLGKFLSLWDCATGEPISFPLETPYEYSTWDWYMINNIDNTTNYRPSWTEYDETASSTVETDWVNIWDVYIYDGTVWLLQKNAWWGWGSVTFAQILWQPTDNTNLATALNAKQDTLTAWTNIQISNNVISATGWAEIVYATQAEYNALPSSKLTDGKHYVIYTSGSSPRLPSAYQEVEYIETTWTQFIDLWLYVDSTIQTETKIEKTVSAQEIPIFWSVQWHYLETDNYYNLIPYQNEWRWGNNWTAWHWWSYTDGIWTQYEILYNDSNNNVVINNTSIGSCSWTKLYSSNYTLGISVRRWTGYEQPRLFWQYKYFYFKLYDKTNSQYVRDLVPCYRKSDSVIWMYDLVNDTFYTNSWTWTFTKWPDVS